MTGMHENGSWECVIVGGGAAGLSAALVLGRARRATLLIDAGAPSNAPSPGIGGLLGQDGRPPAEFYAAARRELAKYPTVEVRAGEVVGATRETPFTLTLADDATVTARRVLLATGADYVLPEVDGLAERFGNGVFHCPFCHGWEHRERPLGVLAGDEGGAHRAVLLRAWSDDVTVYADGPADLSDERRAELANAGIRIDERPVAGVTGDAPALRAITFADGSPDAECDGLLVPVTLRQRAARLAEQLGAETASLNPVLTDAIVVGPMGATDVAGVAAAGDAADQMPSVANAIASGAAAAATILNGLTQELTAGGRAPVA